MPKNQSINSAFDKALYLVFYCQNLPVSVAASNQFKTYVNWLLTRIWTEPLTIHVAEIRKAKVSFGNTNNELMKELWAFEEGNQTSSKKNIQTYRLDMN